MGKETSGGDREGASGIRRENRDPGVPREGLEKKGAAGWATCLREVKERARKDREAAPGFGNMGGLRSQDTG